MAPKYNGSEQNESRLKTLNDSLAKTLKTKESYFSAYGRSEVPVLVSPLSKMTLTK